MSVQRIALRFVMFWFGLILALVPGGCQVVPPTNEGELSQHPLPTLVSPQAVETPSPPSEEAVAEAAEEIPQLAEESIAPEPLVLESSASEPSVTDAMPALPVDTATPTATPSLPVEDALPTPTSTMEAAIAETPQNVVRHVVVEGDTLYAIALRYAVSVESIVAANQLTAPDRISIGQELTIPADLPAPPSTIAVAPAPVEPQPVQVVSAPFRPLLYACPDNSTAYRLQLPADPIQILAAPDRLYFVADGALFELLLGEGGQIQSLAPTSLMPAEKIVGNYLIREFVYLIRDSATSDLLLLDKTNDVYRYSPAAGWTMEVPAQPIPGQFPDPQYLTIQQRRGAILALDADLSHIWQLSPQRPVPTAYFNGGQLASAVDLAFLQDGDDEHFYVLTREGTLTHISRSAGGRYSASLLPVERVRWPSQVHAGAGQLMVVDGEARNVRLYERTSLAQLGQVIFRYPNMQRLRHAAIASQTLYAVAGRTLYVAPFAQLNETCSPVTYDDAFYFDGWNVRELLPHLDLPFPNAILPMRPRSYPGARRLYRYGLHEGLDLYALDAAGLRIGSPVRAIGDGRVTRIDVNFVEMTPGEYEEAMLQARLEHRTGEQWADRLVGRQVHVAHSDQVYSRYGHLHEVSATIAVDDSVERGSVVGTVGVSGTSAGAYGTGAGAHLHFEIWVNGRYLGQGLNLYETMRLWQEVFR